MYQAWEMSQLALPYKQEDTSLDPQTHTENWERGGTCAGNLSNSEMGDGERQIPGSSQASQTGLCDEVPSHKEMVTQAKIGRHLRTNNPDYILIPQTHTCTTHTNEYTHIKIKKLKSCPNEDQPDSLYLQNKTILVKCI